MILGIDIGTSYSSAAILREGKPVPLSLGDGHDFSLPSAVFATESGQLLIGKAAVASRMKAPERFRSHFKRDFGTDKPYLLGDQELLPEQIYTEFFRYFARLAREQGGESDLAVQVTHPAGYSRAKKQLIEQAANYAGLMNVTLLDEPTAASRNFRSLQGKRLLVYDLGGGTFDVSLLELTEEGSHWLTDPLGLESCGGVVFDSYLYRDMVETLSRETDLAQGLNHMKFRAMLSDKATELKHILSEANEAMTSIAYGFGDMLDYTITRKHFEQMIAQDIAESLHLVEQLMENAGLSVADINEVVCVGGSTRIPYVLEQLERFTGKKPLKTVSPELAICLGAAQSGQQAQRSAGEAEENIDVLMSRAKNGDREAGYRLGLLYYRGKGVRQNYITAFRYYYESASKGYSAAQEAVGDCFANSIGVFRSLDSAKKWWGMAAAQGNASAAQKIDELK